MRVIIASLILTGFFEAVRDTIKHHSERTWLRKVIPWKWFWTDEGKVIRLGPFKWKLDGWHVTKELGRISAGLLCFPEWTPKLPSVHIFLIWYFGSALVMHIFYNWLFLINENKGTD